MSLMSTLTNAFVIAAAGGLLYWHSRGRFAELRSQFDREIGDVRNQISELRAESDRRFELVMTQILAIQRDLTHIALAVGARDRPEANPA